MAKGKYGDVMRDPDNINFITLFREPRDRLLSFYTFFVEFETLVRAFHPRKKVGGLCQWYAWNSTHRYVHTTCVCTSEVPYVSDKTSPQKPSPLSLRMHHRCIWRNPTCVL